MELFIMPILLFFLISLIIVSFFKGFFYLTGKRVLISNRKLSILLCLSWSVFLIFSLDIFSKFNYSNNDEFARLIVFLIAILIPLVGAFLFARSSGDAYLMPSTKKEIKMITEEFLNNKGVKFKNEDNVLVLGEKHDDKIGYAFTKIDLSECRDLELKKDLMEHISNDKDGFRDIQKGVFSIILGIISIVLIFYLLSLV